MGNHSAEVGFSVPDTIVIVVLSCGELLDDVVPRFNFLRGAGDMFTETQGDAEVLWKPIAFDGCPFYRDIKFFPSFSMVKIEAANFGLKDLVSGAISYSKLRISKILRAHRFQLLERILLSSKSHIIRVVDLTAYSLRKVVDVNKIGASLSICC